jgi:hypothetical protein
MSIPGLKFVSEFKKLHEKMKKGALTPSERARYDESRAELGRLITMSQQLGHAGDALRSTLRMSKMLKVEIRPDGGELAKSSTIDLSAGGFATLVGAGFAVGKKAAFTLHLPKLGGGGPEPISGRCEVVSSRPQTGAFRVSFKFEPLPPASQERLNVALIDAVLERFAQF